MKSLFTLIFIGAIMISCSKSEVSVSCDGFPVPSDAYYYPIKQGTPAWSALLTSADRLRACQIPDNIVKTMSTDALIQSWLDYPLRAESLVNLGQFIYYYTNSSGLIELRKRNDVLDRGLARYKMMEPACVTNFSDTGISKWDFILSFTYLELVLSQDIWINSASLPTKKLLVAEALKKYNDKKKYDSNYGQFTYGYTLALCAKIMQNANYDPFLKSESTSQNLQGLVSLGTFPIGVTDQDADMQILIREASNFSSQ